MSTAFFIGVYQDQALAKTLISRLRELYPQAEILSLADGSGDLDYADFCQQNQVVYEPGARLKQQNGTAWTSRRFSFFLEKSAADVCIKVDPDLSILSAVPIPAAPVFAPPASGLSVLEGSFFGISRKTIELVLRTGLLGAPRYRNGVFQYKWHDERLLSEDAVLTDVFRRLNIPITPISGFFRGPADKAPADARLIHP